MRRLFIIFGALFILLGSFSITLFLLDNYTINIGRINFFSKLISEKRYNFSNVAIGKPWLGSGWQTPEKWGVWSDGDRAEVELKLDSRSRRVDIFVTAVGYVAPRIQPQQEVSVFVGSKRIATWIFSPPIMEKTNSLTLESADITNGVAKITFVIKHPQSPKSLGISPVDDRKIGFGLLELKVLEYGLHPVWLTPA